MTLDEYFVPVLAWLDAYESYPVGFNMNYYDVKDHTDYSDTECGTVCCMAGYLNRYWKLDCASPGSLADRIGMTEDECDALFYALEPGTLRAAADLPHITPDQAARVLRHFLMTREVNWDV